MKLDRVIAVRNSKTVYRDGDKCIKVFNAEHRKSDVLNEALNQSRVEEAGLCVPRILEVKVIDGKWAIVSEYIKGNTLDRLMNANRQARQEITELFVDLQLQMHAHICPQLPRLRDKLHRKLDAADISKALRVSLHERLDKMPERHEICHGDFDLSNIIIADNGVPYIFDWAHASMGDSSADAARTYLLFWLTGDIDGAKRYLDTFCEKSGTSREYVESWMSIVAAAESAKGNEAKREFLLSWLDRRQ